MVNLKELTELKGLAELKGSAESTGLTEFAEQKIDVEELDDGCMKFSFNFYVIFKVEGKYCKEKGILTLATKICDIPNREATVDLRQQDFSMTQNFGVVEIMHSFYLKGSCIWTKGQIKAGKEIKEWDRKIGP